MTTKRVNVGKARTFEDYGVMITSEGAKGSRAYEYLVKQIRKNPVRFRSAISQIQVQQAQQLGVTQEDITQYEREQAVFEAYRRQGQDVERAIEDVMGRTQEQIEEQPQTAVYVFDPKHRGKPIALPDGRIKFGPAWFNMTPAQRVRYLRNILTQARREARMLEREVRKAEREKYKKKWEAHKTREHVNKRIGQLKKLKNKEWYAKISNELRKPIDDLLANIDLVGMQPAKKRALEEMRDWLQDPQHKDLVELPEGTLEQLARLEMRNIRDMTPEQVETLYQTVMHYALLAYENNQLWLQEQREEFESARNQAIAQMKPKKEIEGTVISSENKPLPTAKAKVGDWFDAWLGIGQEHFDLFVEKIAGQWSVADTVLSKAIEAARTEEMRYKQEMHDRFQQGIEEIGLTAENAAEWFHETETVGKLKLTRAERIALKMHSENEDNWTSIVEAGFGFKFKAGERDVILKGGEDFKVEDLQNVLDSLSREELAVADLLREIDDQIGDDIAKKFVEVNGYEMPRVENHWHKDVMPIGRGSDIREQGVKEMVSGTMFRPGVPKGRLVERKGVVVPLYLNSAIYDLAAAVDWAASYVAFEKPMRQATKLLYDPEFKKQLTQRYGERLWNEIQKGLRDVLHERTARDDVGNVWNVARKGITTAFIAGNVFTMLKQPLQLSNALRYVSPAALTAGVWRTTFDMRGQKRIHQLMSPKFRDRLERGFTRDIVEFQKLRERRSWVSKKADLRKIMFAGVKFFDANTVSAVMTAAIHQVLQLDYKNKQISPEVARALAMTNEEFLKLDADQRLAAAYRFADYVVSRTQDMALPEHRSPLSRGGPVAKAFTMFGTSTNQNWNLLKRSLIEAIRIGNKRAYRAAAYAVLSVLVIQPLAESGIDILRRKLLRPEVDPDDREYLWNVLSNIAGNLLLFRDVFNFVRNRAAGRPSDLRIPVSGALETFGRTLGYGWNAIFSKSPVSRRRYAYRFADSVIDTFLIWAQIPLYYPKSILRGILRRNRIWPYHLQ